MVFTGALATGVSVPLTGRKEAVGLPTEVEGGGPRFFAGTKVLPTGVSVEVFTDVDTGLRTP